MRRTVVDARRWTDVGTALVLEVTKSWGEAEMSQPCGLPGWTRKHLVAHLAANADGLRNLLHWAATGERTPMYSSPEQRNADIETGAQRPAAVLNEWLGTSVDRLAADAATLTEAQWQAEVVTAQGRTVPATEVPWMRAREMCVHAVDLSPGIAFADLPQDFLVALADDVVAKRAATSEAALRLTATDIGEMWELPGLGAPAEVRGGLADIAAYLTGRPHGLTAADGSPAPRLAPWL